MISRPASSGSSDSISCSSALPPPNSVVNSSPNFWFTVPKASSRRWRPSRLRLEMPPRSLLIAWMRSSRSLIRLSSCLATSMASSSARRLTPPSRSRSSRRPRSLCSISSATGDLLRIKAGLGQNLARLALQHLGDAPLAGLLALRAGFQPCAEPRMVLARICQQFLNRPQFLVGAAHGILCRLQRVGRCLALGFGFGQRVHQLQPLVGK